MFKKTLPMNQIKNKIVLVNLFNVVLVVVVGFLLITGLITFGYGLGDIYVIIELFGIALLGIIMSIIIYALKKENLSLILTVLILFTIVFYFAYFLLNKGPEF